MIFLVRIIKILILIPFILIPFFSVSFVPPGDNDYLVLEEEQYRIIFDKQYLDSINTINQKIKKQIQFMSEFKNRKLQKPLTIILYSSRNQISNAFATVSPSFTIGMFPTGVLGLDKMAVPFWFDDVFRHELNHVFQMSHTKYPKIVNDIFNLPSLLFFYIYSPYPNIFLPMFVLEGDAVLKESLSHYGGRLYSGYARALVYSQIKHYRHQIDKFTKENLLMFRRTAHSGKEKYLHGGYFMAMLAERYSPQMINDFFKLDKQTPSRKVRKQIKEMSIKKKLSPLFGEKFSFSYIPLFLEDLGKYYFHRWLKEASLQKSSSEPALYQSYICPEFGAWENEVFFLTSDFRSTPILRVFNKRNKKWIHQKMDLPLGKVFKIGGTYYARSSQTVKPHVRHYSLFSKGFHSYEKFDSQYVQDIHSHKTLYIDPKNNLNGFKLYLNDSLYSEVHSNALFDQKGNIYFFKQKGKTRTLYKNKRPVFSYQGYYGHLLEIATNGTIYFIGASPYGSSIYQYKKGRVSRSVSSDTIVQAKKVNDREFLACEVTPYGYEYKVIPMKWSWGRPVLYRYKFKKQKPLEKAEINKLALDFSLAPEVVANSKTINEEREIASTAQKTGSIVKKDGSKSKTTDLEYKEYSSLSNIKYNGLSIIGITNILASVLGTGVLFSDYLMKNIIILSYQSVFPYYYYFEDGIHFGSLEYQNRVYPLQWGAGYQTAFFPPSYSKSNELSLKHKAYLKFGYPLFRKGRWFSSVSSVKSFDILEDFRSKALWRGQVNWGYSQSFPYNYASNKAFVLRAFLDNQYYFSDQLNGFKWGLISDFVFHLGQEFYLFPSLSYAYSFKPAVNPVRVSLYQSSTFKDSDYYSSSNFHHSSDPYVSRFEDMGSRSFVINDLYSPFFKNRYEAQSVGTVSLGFKKAFDISWGAYSRFVPLGRVRWVILKNLLDSGLLDWEDTVSSKKGQFDKNASIQEIQDSIEISQDKKEKERTQFKEYIQWLEWTGGLEMEFMILHKAKMIIGFSLGIRTPLEFWKKSESSKEEGKKTSSADSVTADSVGGTLDSMFGHIYFKWPL